MEASPPAPVHEIRDGPAAAAAAAGRGGGGGGGLAPLRQRIGIVEVVRRRLHAAAFFLLWGFLGILRALWQLIEIEAAAAFLFRGWLGGLGALRQLVEPEDRRLQAATFLLTFGGCTVINGAVLNRSAANPEHLLVGLVLFTLGAAIAILTLAGGGAGRAAAQVERFIRGFF